MFTVLIACSEEKQGRFSSKVHDLANQYGYELININSKPEVLHSEVMGGVNYMAKSLGLSQTLVVNCIKKNSKADFSCSEISQDLQEFYTKMKSSSTFLDFLKSLENLSPKYLPNKFYLAFADEWENGQDVRMINIGIEGVKDYFKNNNGWSIWTYDLSNQRYVDRNYHIPLVFHINNAVAEERE